MLSLQIRNKKTFAIPRQNTVGRKTQLYPRCYSARSQTGNNNKTLSPTPRLADRGRCECTPVEAQVWKEERYRYRPFPTYGPYGDARVSGA